MDPASKAHLKAILEAYDQKITEGVSAASKKAAAEDHNRKQADQFLDGVVLPFVAEVEAELRKAGHELRSKDTPRKEAIERQLVLRVVAKPYVGLSGDPGTAALLLAVELGSGALVVQTLVAGGQARSIERGRLASEAAKGEIEGVILDWI
jgi:hypothetical protein